MTIDKKTLEAQREYCKEQDGFGIDYDVVAAQAFTRGIRDLGYKDNGKALAELVDNSWEAGSNRVDVLYGYRGKKTKAKPTEIAVLDDGCGMPPEMIRHAVRWGGTHREGSTTGLGKYGFGLPASSVSIGQFFTVYSKLEGGDLFSVTVDLAEIEKEGGNYRIPESTPATLPGFVEKALDGRDWESGTVVVLGKLDRLAYSTSKGLTENLLLNHFGVTYHKLRQNFDIFVDGKFVEPIDPLFLTPGARLYDIDADRAAPLEPLVLDIVNQDTRTKEGKLTLRLSYLPPHFGLKDKANPDISKKNRNARFHIMQKYNGLVVSRMGRVVDVIADNPHTRFVNNDKYIGIELEFDASLDREFGVTTSKQQITISERVWKNLEREGFKAIVTQLRKQYQQLNSDWKQALTDRRNATVNRPSERAMEEAKQMDRPVSDATKEKQNEKGKKNAEDLAKTRAAQSGKTPEEELAEVHLERAGRLYEVQGERLPGAPFFRMDILGGTKILYLNKAHRFYSDVYMGPESTWRLRSAIEIVLFSIGDSMEDASVEARRLYTVEVPEWSMKLENALEHLNRQHSVADEEDAKVGEAEVA